MDLHIFQKNLILILVPKMMKILILYPFYGT